MSAELSDTVKGIGTNAFYSCDNITFYVNKDSYAHKYLSNNNLSYEYILPGNVDGIGSVDEEDIRFLATNMLTGVDGMTDKQIEKANLCEDYDESDKPIIDIKDLIKLAQIVANR